MRGSYPDREGYAERDGVKTFYGEDWVLVLPDPEQPIVHVYAESDSDSKAHALDGRQARLVRSLVE